MRRIDFFEDYFMYRLGYCGWLLTGKPLPEIVQFLSDNGFNSISWLQDIVDADEVERKEAAAAIKELNFALCYHGCVQWQLTPEWTVNLDFFNRMANDVMWWHENTNGVISCCSDSINRKIRETDKGNTYLEDTTKQLLKLENEFFKETGIGYGIENGFCIKPGARVYASIDSMKEYMSILDDPKGIGTILDVGHANIYLKRGNEGKLSLIDYIRQIPFKIYEIHITDNMGDCDAHTAPGTGNIDFVELREGLKEVGFDGAISMEVCKDAAHFDNCFDISNIDQRDQVLRIRDSFIDAFYK